MDGDWQLHAAPTIRPGQIWLVAHPAEGDLSGPARDAIAGANVVIYERSLAPLVARMLPLGSYAEPLSQNGLDAEAAIASRAIEFAALGWSVVQLVEARPDWHARLRAAAAALARADRANALSVALLDGQRISDGYLGDLPELIDDFAEDAFPTAAFGPLVARAAAPSLVFTANGLAG